MIPSAKIIIKLERDYEQNVSKIHIPIPRTCCMLRKKAPTAFEAIDSSEYAILKQIQKIQPKKINRNKLMMMKNQMQMAPP